MTITRDRLYYDHKFEMTMKLIKMYPEVKEINICKYFWWNSCNSIESLDVSYKNWKNKPKPKPFAFPTAFLFQIVRAGRCDIKTSQVAPWKLLERRHLGFTDHHWNLTKNN